MATIYGQFIDKDRGMLAGKTSLRMLCAVFLSLVPTSLLLAQTSHNPLGRGVNFGNMLEASNEGDWGLRVEQRFFTIAKQTGFQHVRLPVSWTTHVSKLPPYKIDDSFLARVTEVVDQGLAAGLEIVLNNHHYAELNKSPREEWPRALAIWKQIAEHFANYPQRLHFELLNEPHEKFSEEPQLWNDFAAECLAIVRRSNPRRMVIIGPVQFNSISSLASLEVPDDPNLLVTIHYYSPHNFTHQGATWTSPRHPTGVAWPTEEMQLSNGWQDWSWKTRTTSQKSGLQVDYETGWAGLNLHALQSLVDLQHVDLVCSAALPLRVQIASDAGKFNFSVIPTPHELTRVSLKDVPADAKLNELVIMNESNDSAGPFVVQRLAIRAGGKTHELLTSSIDQVKNDFDHAAAWGKTHGVPLYLGEFGVYHEAEMDSRERWTRAVRTTAEQRGISWAYWELASGFGIYDPQQQVMRAPLVRALFSDER